MGTKEQLIYFTENLDLKVAKNRSEQLKNLVEYIGRSIGKLYKSKGDMTSIITSQELRKLAIKVEKIHKVMNKRVSFTEFGKVLIKKAEKLKGETKEETYKLHWKLYEEQLKVQQELMLATQNIQWANSKLGLLCTILDVYESTVKREKLEREKEDDELLQYVIYEALVNASWL